MGLMGPMGLMGFFVFSPNFSRYRDKVITILLFLVNLQAEWEAP